MFWVRLDLCSCFESMPGRITFFWLLLWCRSANTGDCDSQFPQETHHPIQLFQSLMTVKLLLFLGSNPYILNPSHSSLVRMKGQPYLQTLCLCMTVGHLYRLLGWVSKSCKVVIMVLEQHSLRCSGNNTNTAISHCGTEQTWQEQRSIYVTKSN